MDFLKQLFTQFPAYFSTFLELLLSPMQTLKQKTLDKDSNTHTHASMTFLVVSFFITLLIIVFVEDDTSAIEGFVNQDTNVLTKFAASAAVYSLLIVIVVAIINTTFKLVGSKQDTKSTHTAIHYIIGMLIVMFTAIDVIGDSIASLDPQVAKYNVVMQKEVKPLEQQLLQQLESSKSGDIESSETSDLMAKIEQHNRVYQQILQDSQMVWVGAIFQLIAYCLVLIWLVFCWRFFAQEAGIGAKRSSLAFIICFIALGLLSTIVDLVSTGNYIQQSIKQKYQDDPNFTLDSLEQERLNQQSLDKESSNVEVVILDQVPKQQNSDSEQTLTNDKTRPTEKQGSKTTPNRSEPKIVARYSGEIGGRYYQYIVTFENDILSRGYLFANDAQHERYDFLFQANPLTGTIIKIYDDAENEIAQGSFAGTNAFGCLEGTLYQEETQPQIISICDAN